MCGKFAGNLRIDSICRPSAQGIRATACAELQQFTSDILSGACASFGIIQLHSSYVYVLEILSVSMAHTISACIVAYSIRHNPPNNAQWVQSGAAKYSLPFAMKPDRSLKRAAAIWRQQFIYVLPPISDTIGNDSTASPELLIGD